MRSKFLMLELVALLFTIAGVNATNDISEVVGPYKISFSLPDDVDVTIDTAIEDGETFEGDKHTSYTLALIDSLNPNIFAYIGIIQYVNGQEDLIDISGMLARNFKGFGYTTVESLDREIDGRPGEFVYGYPMLGLPGIYGFGYLFDNETLVMAVSLFPWDDGTLQMIKTLHIEKVE
jgi:hypothetical protein